MNAFYLPTGDINEDKGLEMEFMLDTGAACDQLQHLQQNFLIASTYYCC